VVPIITSIRSTVMVVEALITILVVVVAALGLLGVGGTPRARFSYSHSLMVCLASLWNWH
jgi:Tfp pilus assembly protein PilV